MTSLPDYYRILEVSPTATSQQIREAYKRAALKSHPDRVPASSPERPVRTKKFQEVNDAYYTLSDARRRQEYDALRKSSQPASDSDYDEEIPRPHADAGAPNAFPWSSFFTSGAGAAQGKPGAGTGTGSAQEDFTNSQFSSVFEEMLREEGMADSSNRPTSRFWSVIGGISGAAMGFIVANMPGAIAGAVAGNRLGSIRDSRGKCVYDVFKELPQSEKARILSELAAKVFAGAVGA